MRSPMVNLWTDSGLMGIGEWGLIHEFRSGGVFAARTDVRSDVREKNTTA